MNRRLPLKPEIYKRRSSVRNTEWYMKDKCMHPRKETAPPRVRIENRRVTATSGGNLSNNNL